jgi:hypothetical protein
MKVLLHSHFSVHCKHIHTLYIALEITHSQFYFLLHGLFNLVVFLHLLVVVIIRSSSSVGFDWNILFVVVLCRCGDGTNRNTERAVGIASLFHTRRRRWSHTVARWSLRTCAAPICAAVLRWHHWMMLHHARTVGRGLRWCMFRMMHVGVVSGHGRHGNLATRHVR